MYEIPERDQIQLVGPDDETPVWWNETPNGRHALIIGGIDDGAVAYAASLDELEEFTARLHAMVAAANGGAG